MKRLFTLIGLVILLVALLPAADVTGTWKGQFDFNGESVPLQFHLKANGDTVTGTIEGLPTNPTDIKDGKVKGNTITFWVTTDYEGATYKLVYEGRISGDEIQFKFGTEDGSWGTDMVAKRSS